MNSPRRRLADLAERRFEALYRHNGTMLRFTNETAPKRAPKFHLQRTPQGIAWRVRFDVPEDVVDELKRLSESEADAQWFSE